MQALFATLRKLHQQTGRLLWIEALPLTPKSHQLLLALDAQKQLPLPANPSNKKLLGARASLLVTKGITTSSILTTTNVHL